MNGPKLPNTGAKYSKKPKILFVYESLHPVTVKDGLWAALEELEMTFDVERVNLAREDILNKFDFILGWGAFGSNPDHVCRFFSKPNGLCIAGNVNPPFKTDEYSVLFYETKWYKKILGNHPNAIRAFGVNTEIFRKINGIHKDIDYLGVGAYANWKRWDKFANKKGKRVIVGEIQVDNRIESEGIINDLAVQDVDCLSMVSPEELVLLYNRAKTVYMPSDIFGGGERVIWEALACGCDVEIEDDNPKLKSLLKEKPMDHFDYADKLKEGILKCL